MKVYLDYVFFINSLFDFILLLGISIVLKRQISIARLIVGTLIGGISGFIIILNISSLSFFIIKLILGLIIVVITFSYKNIQYTMNNYIYLIILSILLGGSLYLLNIEIGKLMPKTDDKLYILLLLITGIITVVVYTKYINKTKHYSSNKYKTIIYINNKPITLIGYLDTGNNLIYKKRPVLIVNKNIKIDLKKEETIYIPFTTINGRGIMKGFQTKEAIINNRIFKNVYIGISNDKFYLKDADIILNINLKEETNEKSTQKNSIKTKRIKRK